MRGLTSPYLAVHHSQAGISQEGGAFIELAIILPVIAFLGFGALEFTRSLRIKQALTAIVREVTNEAFRFCSPLHDPVGCFDDVINRYRSEISPTLPNVGIVLSLYSIGTSSSGMDRQAIASGGSSLGLPNCSNANTCTHFSPSSITFEELRTQGVSQVTVGEVFFPYAPLVSAIGSWSIWKRNVLLYEAIVF